MYKWLCANKLSLHIGKTSCILICSRQKRVHLSESLDLKLDNQQITEVEDVKYLGLTIDYKLRYDKYMLELVGKLNRAIGVLRRASKYIDQKTRVMLYNTLILPHIDYCSTVWGSSISKQDIKKLQRLQNCSMRVILECHPRTHTKDMLDCLKWLSVEQRLDFNMACLVWKIKKGRAPEYMNIFTDCIDTHEHYTRGASAGNIHQINCHSKSLRYNGARIWNTLPPEVSNVNQSFYNFKKSLATFLRK